MILTIQRKVRHAVRSGIGGVMVWEIGQDCRVEAVSHGETVHAKTCPHGEESSLLVAISRELSALSGGTSSDPRVKPDEIAEPDSGKEL